MKNVICLLSGHNQSNIIGEYTISIIQKLGISSDVYYFADNALSNSELKKVVPFVKYADCVTHNGGDFGSWQYLTYYIGWKNLEQYQKIIVCNNRIDFSIEHLDDIYKYIKLNGYDFLAISDKRSAKVNQDSYFLVLDNKIIKSAKFHEFWDNLVFRNRQESYKSVLPQYLTELGFYGNSYLKSSKINKKKGILQIFPSIIQSINHFNTPPKPISDITNDKIKELSRAAFSKTSSRNVSIKGIVKNFKSAIDIFKPKV